MNKRSHILHNVSKNSKQRRICAQIMSVLFLFYSLFPAQFAFAWFADCGPHQVANCETHDNTHLVLVKIEEHSTHSDVDSFSKTDPISHDHDYAHQVQEKAPQINNGMMGHVLVKFLTPVIETTLPTSKNLNPHSFLVGAKWRSDPPDVKQDVILLSTVRIQV